MTRKFNASAIATFRQRRGMTQRELMIKLDDCGFQTTEQTLSRWENGETEPDASDVGLLAKVLGVTINEFFTNG